MKKIIAFMLLLGCSVHLFSKDLIVTQAGDSLKCKISNSEDGYVYFTHIVKGQVKDDKLKREDIKYLERDFYKTVKLTKVQIDSIYRPSRWRVGLSCGYSRWLAKNTDGASDALSSYEDGLKNGVGYSADVAYYFNKSWGVGIKYHGFNSSNSMNDYSITSTDGTTYTGEISDKEWIQYVGPYASYRYIFPDNKKAAWYINLGLGYAFYHDKGVTPVENLTITGHSFGVFSNIGYEYSLTPCIALGFEVGCNINKLSKYKSDDGSTTETVSLDSDEKISLSTLDVAVGLRYNIR